MDKRNVRILVVDDEKGIRDLLEYELGYSGYQVTTSSNGEQALEYLRKVRVNLLISDIKMPKMDGIQVLQAANKIDPDMHAVMATGYGTIESAVAAMKLGAYDFIQKPFNMDELHSIIERALERTELRTLVTLYEASRAIHDYVRADDLLPVLVELSLKLLKADDVSILLLGPDKQMTVAASSGRPTTPHCERYSAVPTVSFRPSTSPQMPPPT